MDLFASRGITPATILELRDVVDGFGVGGYISNADPVEFALDIVEVEGDPVAKRGKLAGVKSVYRTADGCHAIGLDQPGDMTDGEDLLDPLIRDGRIVRELDLDSARDRALEEAERTAFRRD